MKQEGPGHRLVALENEDRMDLSLVPGKPLVIHGNDGVSQKGRVKATPLITFPSLDGDDGNRHDQGKPYKVSGTSWMDHEYSSNQLNPTQIGWDWFSLKLNDGTELMLYQIRLKDGGIDPYSSGTRVTSSGKPQHIKKENTRFARPENGRVIVRVLNILRAGIFRFQTRKSI